MKAHAALAWSAIIALCGFASSSAEKPARALRVCADPNNLPFSNAREEGFENRIAKLIADDLSAKVKYTWWAQRRGFIRNTLNAGECDVVMGVPASFDLTAVTRPYYRSTYVFVTRKDRALAISSFDDPILHRLRIGVQLVGDDGANTPPVHALAARGLKGGLKGYSVFGDYSKPNPPSRIIDAVVRGEVDVAIVWGPLAGYFAAKQHIPLEIVPVAPQIDLPFMPEVFDIAIGVRRQDRTLRAELDAVLERKREEIARILDTYRVPRIDPHAGARS